MTTKIDINNLPKDSLSKVKFEKKTLTVEENIFSNMDTITVKQLKNLLNKYDDDAKIDFELSYDDDGYIDGPICIKTVGTRLETDDEFNSRIQKKLKSIAKKAKKIKP